MAQRKQPIKSSPDSTDDVTPDNEQSDADHEQLLSFAHDGALAIVQALMQKPNSLQQIEEISREANRLIREASEKRNARITENSSR